MTAHSTNSPNTTVYTSECAHRAIVESGETPEDILKSYTPFRTFIGLSTSVGYKLHSGEILMLQVDAENNRVTILHLSEFRAGIIVQEYE
jgi:hypothetical protein